MSPAACSLRWDSASKTVITLTAIQKLLNDFEISKVLCIAPKTVAEDTWTREAAKWDHLQGLRVVKLMGTEKQRLTALDSDADIYVINRENVVWLVETLQKRREPWPFDTVIVDELSSFKSSKSKRWRALKKVRPCISRFVGLTGTPSPNGYMDLWAQVFLIDGGKRLGKTLGAYRDKYFTPGAHKGHIVYEWRLKPGAEEEIRRAISDVCVSMRAEDWIELPDIIYRDHVVRMSAEERKVYDRFQRDRVLPLVDGILTKNAEDAETAIVGDTAAIAGNKLLQMASGRVYDDAGEVFKIHDRKIEALQEIVEAANGNPVLCFYSYKSGKDAILDAFPEAVELDTAHTTEIIDRWSRGEIPLLLAHPASAGYGLNLQGGGHQIVWFGLTWSLEQYEQANARLHRRGQEHSVIVHHILCENTIDGRVMDALHGKADTQNALLRALTEYVKGLK